MLRALTTLVLLLAACSGDSQGGPSGAEAAAALATIAAPAAVPQAASDLLPDDAFLVMRIASLDAFNTLAQDFRDLDGVQRQPVHVLGDLLQAAPALGVHTLYDHRAPALLAMSFPRGGLIPAITAVLPLADGSGYAVRALNDAQAGPATGRCALAHELPGGVFSVRVDAQAALGTYRPVLEMGLQQAVQMAAAMSAMQPGAAMDMQAMMAIYVDVARQIFDAAEFLELAVARQGDALALTLRLQVLADSPLAGQAGPAAPLADFAGFADPQAAVSFVYGSGEDSFVSEDFLEYFAGVYPAQMRETFTDLVAMGERFRPLMGRAGAGSMEFEQGIHQQMAFQVKDADAYVAAYKAMLVEETGAALEELGMDLVRQESVLDEGGAIHRFLYDFDVDFLMQSLGTVTDGPPLSAFGFPEQMEIALLPHASRLGMVTRGGELGNDELARLRARLAEPPPVAEAYAPYLQWIGDTSPAGVLRIDLARTLGQMMSEGPVAAMLPDQGESMRKLAHERMPLTMFAAVDPLAYRGGLTFDLADARRVLDVMQ